MRPLLLFFIVTVINVLPIYDGAPTEIKTLNPPLPEERNFLTCAVCNRLIHQVFAAFDNGTSDDGVADIIVSYCNSANLYNEKVCRGTALLALPTVRYIYQKVDFIGGNVCGILLQTGNCTMSDPGALEWTIKPSTRPKPPITEPVAPPQGAPTIKVLHLSDIHWDPEYKEGSNANCDDPLCCRTTSGDVLNSTDAAGYWGDYRDCDSPWRTIENAVKHMATQKDIAYIVWTGDLVPHDVWDTAKAENIMIIDKLMGLIKQYFPSTPVYPTLGNHESSPVNTFAPPEITDVNYTTTWLYDTWYKWLPADANYSTVSKGGYYTTLNRPGLRIVSMNMNYCYTLNWWTLYHSIDPASGLLWLSEVLENAELAGEKVHILSHIPPGNGDCWTIFSREFKKIISRFEGTVAAQFYGHTHNEEYKVYFDIENATRAINVAFVGGSVTPYSDLNPGYRVYTVDGERSGSSWGVLDFSTWVMNLTEANVGGATKDPVWYELYQAKKEYNLENLSPKSMHELHTRMLNDTALFQLYFRNYYKGNDIAVNEGCDAKCRSELLCYIITTDAVGDQKRCEGIKQIINHEEL